MQRISTKRSVKSPHKEKILKTCAIYGILIFCHKKSIAKISIIKYQISNIKLKNQKSMKGIIKERRTADFCHFSTDFLNFSTIFQHSFQQKSKFSTKIGCFEGKYALLEKIWILLKTQVFNICGIRPKTGVLEMRLKYFWLYTPENEPTA